MDQSQKERWSLIIFPLAGLFSALLSLSLNFPLGFGGMFLFSAIFGACNAVCLHWLFGLRSVWRTVLFIAASAVSAFISVRAAGWTDSHLALFDPIRGESMVDPERLFAGGFVGAFVILITGMWAVSPAPTLWSTLLKAFCGALVGGILGVGGWAAGPLFYRIRSHLRWTLHGGDYDQSLVIIWETGLALVLALLLRLGGRNPRRVQPEQQ